MSKEIYNFNSYLRPWGGQSWKKAEPWRGQLRVKGHSALIKPHLNFVLSLGCFQLCELVIPCIILRQTFLPQKESN